MFEVGLITFREGLEAFLVVAIAASYLLRTGQARLLSAVQAGLGMAVLLSAGLGLLLMKVGGLSPVYEGWLALVAAVLVISCTVHVLRHGKKIASDIRAGIDKAGAASGRGAWLALFAFILLMVGREGVEAATMVASLAHQQGQQLYALGGLLGLAGAAGLAGLWARYGHRINLTLFFRVTSVFMVLFSAQLVIYAFHEFSEIHAVPLINNELWHEATEAYGPEGKYGIWLSYSLILAPLAFLVGSLLASRRPQQMA